MWAVMVSAKGELKDVKKKRTKEADLHTYFNMPEHWKDHR